MIDLPLPYWTRLGLLGLVLGGIALVDLALKRERATRWREYLFLMVALVLGATYGILVDQVTSRISREYFTIFKGLSELRFGREVVELGAQAGMGGAAIPACIVLLVDSHLRKGRSFQIGRLLGSLRCPLLWSIGMAVLLGAIFRGFVPDSFVEQLVEWVELDRAAALRTVIGAHYGLYLGGVVGTVISVNRLIRFHKEEKLHS